jgi:hypothetical protein
MKIIQFSNPLKYRNETVLVPYINLVNRNS